MRYTIINSAVNNSDQPATDMTELRIIHNAGFFSCNTIALMDIVHYFNENKGLPDRVDRSEQYINYKSDSGDNMIAFYYAEDSSIEIPYTKDIPISHFDCMSIQWRPYKDFPFVEYKPFIDRYFKPSNHVGNIAYDFSQRYKLDYDNLCAVFYRGNDKNREMKVAPYDAFIEKAKEIKAANPNMKFLVQPDETEFLTAFKSAFPDSIAFSETPHMSKKDSAVFLEMPKVKRAEFGAKFFAALLCLSRCKHVITHSGNLGLWTCLYRGNADNVHQIFDDKWIQ